MPDTLTPHRASADARPSAEAGEVARSLERCNDSRCFSWFDHHRLCEKCEEAALALDRFRAAGVREWQPIETAPNGWGKFFLVKPKGRRPGTGLLWVPTVVQRVDGQIYTPDNEIEPIELGQTQPPPFYTELEWMPLP